MNLFRLCRAFKIWNVNEVARQMPSQLMTEWIAFLKIVSEEQMTESARARAKAEEGKIRAHREMRRR